jgi:plastocyanin
MGAYDWWILEEPPYNPATWAKIAAAREDKSLRPLSEAVAYEALPVDKGVHKSLKIKAPDVYELLQKMNVGLEPINKTAAWAVGNDIQSEWEKAAIYYLKTYEDRWSTWMPDKEFKKVKEALEEASTPPSNLGRFHQGRALHLNVVKIKRVPVLRYATVDLDEVVRHWRLTPSAEDLELVMVNLKVENHTATSAIVNVDQQAAQLRDFARETYIPIDLDKRLYQDFRGQAAVEVRLDQGQCFDPNQVYITAGTKVTWVNEGSVDHFVTSGLNTTTILPGRTYSYIFGKEGTSDYECSAEGVAGQAARIVVEEEARRPLPEKEQSILFVHGLFDLKKDEGIDGWIVFEAPSGTKFRDFRWLAGDSITIPLP